MCTDNKVQRTIYFLSEFDLVKTCLEDVTTVSKTLLSSCGICNASCDISLLFGSIFQLLPMYKFKGMYFCLCINCSCKALIQGECFLSKPVL